MKDSLRVKKLTIEGFNGSNFAVPIFEIGEGAPKIAILNGLHGLERTGAYLMDRLIKEVKVRRGLVSFIPFANPSSALSNTRLTPEDNQDLNRIFPGDSRGTLSFRLAAGLFKYLKGFDLTIDIHTFPKMQMPIVAVYLAGATTDKKMELLKIIRILGPDFIWKLDTKSDEKSKAGSLIEALQKVGKLAFSLEVPDIEIISKRQEKKAVTGMLRTINSFLNKERSVVTKNRIPVITRVAATAPASGFFLPLATVKQKIQKGKLAGFVLDLENFQRLPVTAPCDGTVVFSLQKTFVTVGERVVLVGKAVEGNEI